MAYTYEAEVALDDVRNAWKKVIEQRDYIETHDYRPYDRPQSQSNGSEAVRNADIRFLKNLQERAEMFQENFTADISSQIDQIMSEHSLHQM